MGLQVVGTVWDQPSRGVGRRLAVCRRDVWQSCISLHSVSARGNFPLRVEGSDGRWWRADQDHGVLSCGSRLRVGFACERGVRAVVVCHCGVNLDTKWWAELVLLELVVLMVAVWPWVPVEVRWGKVCGGSTLKMWTLELKVLNCGNGSVTFQSLALRLVRCPAAELKSRNAGTLKPLNLKIWEFLWKPVILGALEPRCPGISEMWSF